MNSSPPAPDDDHGDDPRHQPLTDDSPSPQFHLWRLLGFITVLMLLLAGVSALLDILMLGWDR